MAHPPFALNFDQLAASYVPYVQPWCSIETAPSALCLASDTPQWVRALQNPGFSLCQRPGDVDIGTYLASQPAQSQALLSAIGMLDSMSSDALVALTIEAVRILRPGGILLISGHNPEHPLSEAKDQFAQTGASVLRDAGFVRTRVLRLNAPHAHPTSLKAALFDPSPDMALIGQLPSTDRAFQAFYPVFASDPGKSVAEAVAQVDQAHADMASTIATLETRLEDLEFRLERATRRRGLRRLAEKIRTARRDRKSAAVKSPDVAPPPPPPTPDRVPLSDREQAIARALTVARFP